MCNDNFQFCRSHHLGVGLPSLGIQLPRVLYGVSPRDTRESEKNVFADGVRPRQALQDLCRHGAQGRARHIPEGVGRRPLSHHPHLVPHHVDLQEERRAVASSTPNARRRRCGAGGIFRLPRIVDGRWTMRGAGARRIWLLGTARLWTAPSRRGGRFAPQVREASSCVT